MGWRGERVVAFEEMPRLGADRNQRILEAPVTMASGSFKGALIQDREDRRKARRAGIDALEKQSKGGMRDAREWAALVGFTPQQQSFAATAAVMLRSSLGAGNVTKRMVFERCGVQYPDLFSELTLERAA